MLLPAIGMVRDRGAATACLAKLRSQGAAAHAFAEDHAGRLQIGGRIFTSDLNDPSRLTNLRWYTETTEFARVERPVPMPAALLPYLGGELQTTNRAVLASQLQDATRMSPFACSGDPNVGLARTLANRTLGWSAPLARTSYGFNDAVLGANPQEGPRAFGWLRLVTRPATTMLFADAEPREPEPGFTPFWVAYFNQSETTTLLDCYRGDRAGSPSTFPVERHAGALNILFVDGHVRGAAIDADHELASIGISGGVIDGTR